MVVKVMYTIVWNKGPPPLFFKEELQIPLRTKKKEIDLKIKAWYYRK